MEGQDDRRTHRRLRLALPVECVPLDSEEEPARRGMTCNIGSGGLYFETDAGDFSPGSMWRLSLTVPPGEGHFSYTGQVHGTAEVLRVDHLPGEGTIRAGARHRWGVAARFRENLELRFQDP